MVTVADMHSLGWGLDGVACQWCKMLFVWEEELVGECVKLLNYVVLQADREDIWVWNLHSSHHYMVCYAYNNISAVDGGMFPDNSPVIWLKTVPLKINIFV